MDRTYLNTYITGQYAPLIAAAGLTAATDNATGYGPALDSVMRQLGLDTSSVGGDPTIPTGVEGDAILLTRYYALDWLLQALAAQVDERTADQSARYSQLFTQVESLLARALAQIPPQYNVTPADFAYGRLQLDFLEPATYGVGISPWQY